MHACPLFTYSGRFATGFATGLQLECNCNATAMQLAHASGSLPPGSLLPVRARDAAHVPTFWERANAAFLKRWFCTGACFVIAWVVPLSPHAYLVAARVCRDVAAGFFKHAAEPKGKRPESHGKTEIDR